MTIRVEMTDFKRNNHTRTDKSSGMLDPLIGPVRSPYSYSSDKSQGSEHVRTSLQAAWMAYSPFFWILPVMVNLGLSEEI